MVMMGTITEMKMEIIEVLVMMEMSKLQNMMSLMELSVIMMTITPKRTAVRNVVLTGQISKNTGDGSVDYV